MNTHKILTDSECAKCLDYFRTLEKLGPVSYRIDRNKLIFLLMLDAGLRVGEVSKLRKDNLLFEEHYTLSVTVPAEISKTGEARQIPTTERLRLAIDNMDSNRWRPLKVRHFDYAFFTTSPSKHITVRQIQRIVSNITTIILSRSIHPHVLRHTFATRLMKQAPMPVVQKLLGHKRLSSTGIYTHPSDADLKDAIEKLHEFDV